MLEVFHQKLEGNHTVCYSYFHGYYTEYSVSYLIKLGVRIIIIVKAWKKNGGTWLGHTSTYVIYFVDTSGVNLFEDISRLPYISESEHAF